MGQGHQGGKDEAPDRWVRVTEDADVQVGGLREVGQGHLGGRQLGQGPEEAEMGDPWQLGRGHQGGRDGGPRQVGQGHRGGKDGGPRQVSQSPGKRGSVYKKRVALER